MSFVVGGTGNITQIEASSEDLNLFMYEAEAPQIVCLWGKQREEDPQDIQLTIGFHLRRFRAEKPERRTIILKDFIYFTFRKRGRKGEREREKHQYVVACGCLSHTPNWGPGLQHRHVP